MVVKQLANGIVFFEFNKNEKLESTELLLSVAVKKIKMEKLIQFSFHIPAGFGYKKDEQKIKFT